MRKKKTTPDPTPETGVSVIEKTVPSTRIEKTIKLTIRGTEFELTFEEANKISDEIRTATGADGVAALKKMVEDSRKRRPVDDDIIIPQNPYPPFRPRPHPGHPYPWERPPIWY